MDQTDSDILYQALLSRDPRHDGRFYFGVSSTGIYCRPTCAARPKREHVRFFKSKAEAEQAGYRPCLRCRPDLSPASIQWQGTGAVVARACGMIDRGEADGTSLASLAERLGITDRHLRRLFREHLGASPIEVAISRRLHLARQLLSQTALSITDIALASGFNSLRRFNDAFAATYRKSPGAFRQGFPQQAGAENSITLQLSYLPPYDWDTMIRYLSRHEVSGVDAVEDGCYLRHLKGPGGESFLKVRHLPASRALEVSLALGSFGELRRTVALLRGAFDLDHNPGQILLPGAGCEPSPVAEALAGGLRVPGAFDGLETAVAIILGQLVSTAQGRLNLKKLVERFGEPSRVGFHPRLSRFFPAPETLAREDLSVLGFTKVRSRAINELARAVLEGRLALSRSTDPGATRRSLAQIKGIGPWTIEMIALRCLGETDAFPGSDLVLKRALAGCALPPEAFRPWRSYLAVSLWNLATAHAPVSELPQTDTATRRTP